MTHHPLSALIDAGTNTFKLVIYRHKDDPLSAIVSEKEEFVKLWEPAAGHISQHKAGEAIHVLQLLKQEAQQRSAGTITLFCTEAFRTSTNGPYLLQEIQSVTGISPIVLTGDQEAEILAKVAIHYASGRMADKFIAMDIGGGSTEVAIADPAHGKVLEATSLPWGGSAIFHHLGLSDPLRKSDIEQIAQVAARASSSLQNFVQKHHIKVLVGSAGVFESLATMYHFPMSTGDIAPDGWKAIDLQYLHQTVQQSVQSTAKERAQWNGLKPQRAPYIAAAFVFLNEFVKSLQLNQLYYSRLGLKEGLVLEANRQ